MTATLLDWPTAPAGLQPAADEVHVWAAALDRPAAEVAELSRSLSEAERERAARFRHQPSRDEFIVARAVLRVLLAECLGVRPREVRFCADGAGQAAAGRRSRRRSASTCRTRTAWPCSP